jgi:hypothetical protein
MKHNQRLYASPSLTKDLYNEKSINCHRKNLYEIRQRKNKLYTLNEDYIEIKKRSQSPKISNNANCKFNNLYNKLILVEQFEIEMSNNSISKRLKTLMKEKTRVK